MKMENFEQASQDIREIEWVKQQVKAELSSLQQNVQQELFYQKDGDKVTYNLALVKTYLEHIKEKSWSEITQKNSSAWIMAVQIALESQGYDVGKVDGLWGSSTKAAVESFQDKNGLNIDGKPGRLTIQKLAEVIGTPVKAEGTPAQAEGTPAQAEGTPAQAAETPAQAAETPVKAEGTPAKAAETPAQAEGTPAQAEGTPVKAEGIPVKAEGIPAQAAETPVKAAETPAQAAGKLAEKSEKIPQIQLSDLGEWQGNKFIFKEGVEKTDQKGKYIEIGGQRYDQKKEGMTGLGYDVGINSDDIGRSYFGAYINGKRVGKGKYTWSDGDVYEGDSVDGRRTGKGKYTWSNGDVYEGDFVDSRITGKGKCTWSDGDVYEGDFVDGRRTGKGKYTWSDGDVYEGDFENNMFKSGKKTYPDDKPVIEGKFNDEGKLIKEEVEEQKDQATETTYTGQVNATNKQKHGSGRTTFKDKQTEGGYYENGKLLFGGKKTGKDLSQQRGTVKLTEKYRVNEKKQRYQDRIVESWGNKISLRDDALGYHFFTASGAELTLPKSLGRQKALAAANLINAAVGIVKNSGFQLDEFEADGDILQADYKKYVWDTNLIKNVQEKFGVSATVLAAWMNKYRKDVRI